MQSIVAAGAVLAAIASTVAAAPAPAAPAGRFVQWDVYHNHPLARIRRREEMYVQGSLMNNISDGGYFVNVKIGTPAQDLTMLLDTGSSDFWVPDSASSNCQVTRKSEGCTLGSFDTSASSTFTVTDEDGFAISYIDGSESSGDYFTDTVTFSWATLENFTMGLGSKTTVKFGIIGVGFAIAEAIVDENGDGKTTAYANLPIAMVNANLIESPAYSLWLNDLDASTGNILFGGVDTEKYTGELTILDMIASDGVVSDFRVPLTSVTAVSSTGQDTLTSADYPIGAVLDSGTTVSYLPNTLAKQVWEEAGAIYESDTGYAMIPCSRASSGGHFTFTFGGDGGAQIKVGMDELVVTTGLDGAYFTDGKYKGEDACIFGIQNATEPADGGYDFVLLGDTFLRSAYVVYDLANKQVGLAQTNFNATATNIQTFGTKGGAIPVGSAAPSQSSLTTATGTVATPTVYNAAAGFSSTATPTGETSSNSSSTGSKNAAGAMTVPTGLLHTGVISAMMFVAGGMLLL